MASTDRSSLEKSLANLLQYDEVIDEIPDILDNLLQCFSATNSSSSHAELLEHMVAWLGNDGDEIRLFVDNFLKFQRGEKLIINQNVTKKGAEESKRLSNKDEGKNKVRDSSQVESKMQQERIYKEKKQKEAQFEREKLRKRQQKEREEQQRKRLEEENKRKREKREMAIREDQRRIEAELKLSMKNKSKPQIIKKDDKPPPPQKGKATTVCGCFGTKYKPLTNCLHCGRIVCEKEGYGYCAFCGNLIEEIQTIPGTPMDEATIHKERLLRYDKECAKRTKVYDDQADYFKSSTSTWLTEEERENAFEQDEKQRKEMHQRKKVLMKVSL